MQRLFSTFANGWPGFGLLVVRLTIGITLVFQGVMVLQDSAGQGHLVPHIIGAVSALFVLAGLWTPLSGAAVAASEVWIALAGVADPWVPVRLAIFSAALAMIGPGAYSIDARLFGRKHIVAEKF